MRSSSSRPALFWRSAVVLLSRRWSATVRLKLEQRLREHAPGGLAHPFRRPARRQQMPHYREAISSASPHFSRQRASAWLCVEAMMFSLPVVATRWRGFRTSGRWPNGTVGRARDVAGFPQRSKRLRSTCASAALSGEAGRKRLSRSFAVERYVHERQSNSLVEWLRPPRGDVGCDAPSAAVCAPWSLP